MHQPACRDVHQQVCSSLQHHAPAHLQHAEIREGRTTTWLQYTAMHLDTGRRGNVIVPFPVGTSCFQQSEEVQVIACTQSRRRAKVCTSRGWHMSTRGLPLAWLRWCGRQLLVWSSLAPLNKYGTGKAPNLSHLGGGVDLYEVGVFLRRLKVQASLHGICIHELLGQGLYCTACQLNKGLYCTPCQLTDARVILMFVHAQVSTRRRHWSEWHVLIEVRGSPLDRQWCKLTRVFAGLFTWSC